ncbi:MAG: DUF1801 domain-containing protein [Melioribacteraceae bacterium]|nr:DUF1801 domain-containing protein [Melioribacteraceae bacterium]MCF8355392.1 DUF1801 domain-containing protein [Melioribacteraceae bacterium]MCF8394637.1 DUF1801 domain-containing protein [Melioribacteraceae bacterium]MCF8419634.1 DUF1801 domain-containing protein [Melioribacteraceae bacterium]
MTFISSPITNYVRNLDSTKAQVVRTVLEFVKKRLPADTEELVKLDTATYFHHNKDIFGIAARKSYFQLYIPDKDVMNKYIPDLGDVDLDNGRIKFKHLEDLKMDILGNMIDEMRDRIIQ